MPHRPLSKRKRFWFRFVLVMIGAGVPLAIAEAVLRFTAYHADQAAVAAWQQVGIAVPEGERAQLVHIIRPSSKRRLIYELRPGLDVVFEGARTTTNAAGFRSPDCPTEKPADTFRILGIGDSGMFGQGVGNDENFLALVRERLNGIAPGRRFETINTGVPGYNTVMEAETLERKGLAYDPDLLIVDFCGNDLDLPNFIRDPDDYFSLEKSFVIEWAALACTGVDRLTRRPLVNAPRHRDLFRYENDPERAPAHYRDMVGLTAYRRAMRRIARLANAHGIPVIVTCHTRAPDYVREICRELEFPVIDIGPRVERYMREHGIEHYLGSVLSVSATDPHGSAITHRLFADVLFPHLRTHPQVREFLGTDAHAAPR
ncbi:MAG: SGNH/GDSL hydrolase family protein [bacterium]|nr:SGNH/GDSL hydrolase family protein [bacterium]